MAAVAVDVRGPTLVWNIWARLKREPAYGRQIAKDLDSQPGTVRKALDRMVDAGYAERVERIGRTVVYRAGKEPPTLGKDGRGARHPKGLKNGFGAGRIALEEVWGVW